MTTREANIERGDLRGGALGRVLLQLERHASSGTLNVRPRDADAALIVLLRGRVAQLRHGQEPARTGRGCHEPMIDILGWEQGRFLFRPFTRPPRPISGPTLSPAELISARNAQRRTDPGAELVARAQAAVEAGSWAAAMHLCEEAWDLGSEAPELYAILGYAKFMDSERTQITADGCFALLHEAERKAPNMELVQVYIAAIHTTLGQTDQARRRLARVRG